MTTVRAVMTPGFQALQISPGEVMHYTGQLGGVKEPSMIVVDPKAAALTTEDDGRTVRVPGKARYWVIRDDHESDCSCGCGGVSIVTFLLPEEN